MLYPNQRYPNCYFPITLHVSVEYKRIAKVEPLDKGSNDNFEKQFKKKSPLSYEYIIGFNYYLLATILAF